MKYRTNPVTEYELNPTGVCRALTDDWIYYHIRITRGGLGKVLHVKIRFYRRIADYNRNWLSDVFA